MVHTTTFLPNYDMVILAPQVRTYYQDMKADTDRLGIELIPTKGKQYIELTHDPAGAIKFVMSHVNAEAEKYSAK